MLKTFKFANLYTQAWDSVKFIRTFFRYLLGRQRKWQDYSVSKSSGQDFKKYFTEGNAKEFSQRFVEAIR